MAKERMVTRTVALTECEVMLVDITKGEVSSITQNITGKITDNSAAMKACKKLLETETVKVVAITKMLTRDELYGMTEADFIAQAEILPPRKQNDGE